MTQAKEIRGKISSIKNTQKITHAMELVAASKMRRAQERMRLSHPYARKIRQVIAHVASSHSEYRHPYLQHDRPVKRVGFVVVSSDRGLCGGLNVNLFRAAIKEMKSWADKDIDVDTCLIGKKAESFFTIRGASVLGLASQLGDAPVTDDLIGVVKVMLDNFDQGKLDAVFIASNEFVNTMTQRPTVRQLLPLVPEKTAEEPAHWDYIYEPDEAQVLLDMLLKRYIESQVYQSVVENIACEQAARMIAMKNATDNAGNLIEELRLIYNKARQATITREIAEIVSGADALD